MRAKSIGRLAGLAILATSFAAANTGTAVAIAGDTTIEYADNDNAMNAAQSQAQDTLPKFFQRVLSDDGHLLQDAGVKVAVPTSNDGLEIIWVSPFMKENNGFVGLLANDPESFEGQVGDPIAFSADQVRDWYVFGDNGKMYGNFTTRVMLADMSPELASQIQDMLAPAPLPDTW